MKRAIAYFLILVLLLALCGCTEAAQQDSAVPSGAADTSKKTPVQPYAGELPADLFGIFDEESYTNSAFGVKYLRDGRWTFCTMQELARENGGSDGEDAAQTLKRVGFAYDLYARNGSETARFALAIPETQFGKTMTEAEYAQAVKEASARDYAGADYDVVSDEVGTIQFGDTEHACLYLTVAASGMVIYTAQVFLQRDDFVGIIYVSAADEEARNALLNSFGNT